MHQIELPALEAIVRLDRCDAPPPVPVVTTAAPVREHRPLYLAAGGCLYAVNAADGRARWCQQVKLIRTREVIYPPEVSVPPPPRVHFATPRVVDGDGVNGMVYVCIDGFFSSYTCAFAADDGALRWWTPTDARVSGGHFMDWAVPLVHDGTVYSGTYALNAQDGAVRWRVEAINTLEEETLALHALADQTLYTSTQRGISAINTQDGQIRWRYQPEEPRYLSGPPVVSGHLLYAGTGGGGYPPKGHCFAFDVETGTEVWRYPIDSYIGAVVQHETIYVSSGDRSLYALNAKSGALRWRQPFAAPGQYLRDPAIIANDVLYLTADGVYALRSADGEILWHQPLGSSPSVSFCQPVVLDGAVYLVRLDKHGGVLYALNTHTGAEYWHTPYPSRGAGLGVAQ
ncbi:MAG TPA: PQQ-binding-like beta-propeller repeat protein [Ktedonobacterales bacterium]|nr:PQQ-binding-like beta-propeller repeat protein [Ktedonobacterales bacterium]